MCVGEVYVGCGWVMGVMCVECGWMMCVCGWCVCDVCGWLVKWEGIGGSREIVDG